ncbi:MAG: SDR family NAD(P)-dependent oxidoreductase [Thermodesulfobacteriota bacterium]
MKHVVITGVSSGIGKSIALKLLKSEYFVIGTVRNNSDSVQFYEKYPKK